MNIICELWFPHTMSCTVLYQGRRHKISLPSRHAPVHQLISLAKAAFGIEGSFGLRTTRGRRQDVDPGAAWAHTGLPNNCELELVPAKAAAGGVRVAAAVAHLDSAPRTVNLAADHVNNNHNNSHRHCSTTLLRSLAGLPAAWTFRK